MSKLDNIEKNNRRLHGQVLARLRNYLNDREFEYEKEKFKMLLDQAINEAVEEEAKNVFDIVLKDINHAIDNGATTINNMSEEQKNTEDARGEAIKAIVSRIGHGITLQEANILIRTVLVNWHKAQTE